MLYSQPDFDRQLRELLAQDYPLGDALRILHGERGIGLMWLWPAVMAVTGRTKEEAMKIVVHETWNLRNG